VGRGRRRTLLLPRHQLGEHVNYLPDHEAEMIQGRDEVSVLPLDVVQAGTVLVPVLGQLLCETKGKIGAVTLLDHVRLPNPGLLVVTSLQPGGKRATGPKEHDEDRPQEVQEDLKQHVLPPPSSPQSPGGRSRCPWPPPWPSTQAGPRTRKAGRPDPGCQCHKP